MKKIILRIGGMSCSACSLGLEKYLKKQNGIINASVNLVMNEALIEYEDNVTMDMLEKFVKEAGFESLGTGGVDKDDNKKNKDKIELIIFGVLSLIVLYISMSHMLGFPTIIFLDMKKYPVNYAICLLILIIPFLIYGKDIFKSGIKNLVHKTPNMDTLVSLGVISSFLYSFFNMIMILMGNKMYVENLYFESCAIIIFFLKLGRFIEGRSKEKTKEALKELVQITPSKALLKVDNSWKEVTIDEVKKGDILVCKPGMKIAVDGKIVKGITHLDEAFITGESIPVKKRKGDKVIAGSINQDGFIEYEAVKIGKDSTISEIVRLVREASNTKAPIQKIADFVSSYFVPTIIIIAILTLIGYLLLGKMLSEAVVSFVTVLVVACPCALGLATPLAIVVSEGRCAKNGILVKSNEILENASKIDTIVFDKTGTITYGNLKISKIFNLDKDNNFMSDVVSLENKSNHPISRAIVSYGRENKLKVREVLDFKEISGVGLFGKIDGKEIYVGNAKLFEKLKIENNYINEENNLTEEGNSVIYIIKDKKVVGLIGVKDIVRDNVEEVIRKLKLMNKEVIMLTGDNNNTAKIIAKSVGIDRVVSNVLPSEKTKFIKDLINNGKKVMMVGDGINDAPSLVTANIGVSINSGTDIAMDSADVILIQDNLERIIDLLKISKRTLGIIKQNLFWAFFYNILMIPMAIGGLKSYGISMNPMLAGMAMMISSLTVVFNSLRLRKG